MTSNKLRALWLGYAQQVLPLASSTQLQQSEQDFYAGMTAMLQQITMLGDPSISEEQAMAHIQSLQDELFSTIQARLPNVSVN